MRLLVLALALGLASSNRDWWRPAPRPRPAPSHRTQLRLSQAELRRRQNRGRWQRRADRPRDYFPSQSGYSNYTQLERTPEYTVEQRGGDTIIEFARSGEAQGECCVFIE